MKMMIATIPTMLTALLILSANCIGQTPQKTSTFTITGHAGEAQVLQANGKSYIEIQTLARLTQGTLSFKADQTILTLPAADSNGQASAPHVEAGFSRAFVQAGIEEIGVIRKTGYSDKTD